MKSYKAQSGSTVLDSSLSTETGEVVEACAAIPAPSGYRAMLQALFRGKLTGAAIALVPRLGTEFLPQMNEGDIHITEGADDLDPEENLTWQFWASQFAFGWTFPPVGVKPGEKKAVVTLKEGQKIDLV